MKNAWDSYFDQQLANPTVRQAYEAETKKWLGVVNAQKTKPR